MSSKGCWLTLLLWTHHIFSHLPQFLLFASALWIGFLICIMEILTPSFFCRIEEKGLKGSPKTLTISFWLCHNSDHQLQCIGFSPKKFCNTSCVSYISTQFWHYVHGDGIRSHRLRFSPTRLPPPHFRCPSQVKSVTCASDWSPIEIGGSDDPLFGSD